MYLGPVNTDNADSNTIASILETGTHISSYYNENDIHVSSVYGFEHNVDGWKYVVVFLDGREPVDFY